MDFVIYTRVSTKKQGESGLGLEAQLKAARSYIDSQGGKALAVFHEVASGKKKDRTVLTEALERCQLTNAKLVIAKLDRLSRNAAFTMALYESGVEFVACDMPHANKLTIGLMAQIAEFEAEQTSDRTKKALAAAKERGVKLGNPNLDAVRPTETKAATTEHKRVAEEWRQRVVKEVNRIYEDLGDDLSIRELVDELNKRGIKTRRKGQMNVGTLHRALKAA